MSVMEMLRSARGASARWEEDPGPPLGALVAARRGAGVAGATALLVVLPVVLTWLASPQSTDSWVRAAATGASLWLMSLGARVELGGTVLAVVPLLGTVVMVGLAARSAAGVGLSVPGDSPAVLGVPRQGVRLLLAWAGGYAAAVAVAAALALLSPVRPTPASVMVPVVLAPLAALVLATVWLCTRGGWTRVDPGRVPGALVLARAWRPAAWGVVSLLGTGTVAVVALVLAHAGDVRTLHDQLGAGVLGGLALVLGQLALLPNLGLWAVSFAAGPGFQVVEGAGTTWTGSRGGLMPLVPVLGAMPEPGALPGWMPVTVLVPVLVGALVAALALRGVSRLTGLLTKGATVLLAVVLTTAAMTLLALLGRVSLGDGQLSAIGVPVLPFAGMLAAELAVGALVVYVADLVRVRR